MDEILNRVTIITRREKEEELRLALKAIGIDGMTVTEVEGCGVQRAEVRYYRGVKAEVRLLPKVMFEIVAVENQVDSIIDSAKKVLHTGKIGDGKVFIEEESRMITIRTGKEIKVEKEKEVNDMLDQMSKVTIITRREKFEELREELLKIGVMGMTLTEVRGCGIQKGKEIVVRGVKKQVHLIDKVKIDIVVCTVPVDEVIDAAKKVLHTGEIGDGKIFVSDIKRVVRIRTGEEDKSALTNQIK